ncbi:hypothetical protein L5515_014578 [Caenorhabditis briggsae]|uniref:Protein CBR-TAG-319 n=1 Tax=Caenorhabditis briggsae TaxID=6238 RepID=A0AAE9EDP6_CAEBR|nr:hypothetical protein L5515_014578 [Caenorhabditis briggsae]
MSLSESHRQNPLNLILPASGSPEKSNIIGDALANDVDLQTGTNVSSFANHQTLQNSTFDSQPPPVQSLKVGKCSADIIYEGGLEEKVDPDEYKMFDQGIDSEPVEVDGNEVEIDVRGVKYKIPYAIECHLCNEMMNLCLRRTRYRGEQREYPAYRCNRKGCQTFRSIRKVFSNCTSSKGSDGKEAPYMVYDPSMESPRREAKPPPRGEFSEDDDEEFVVQRVYLPKPDERNADQRPLSVMDRMRKANQRRATVFSEFADQLRRDIAANKRIRVRKQPPEEDEQQGTLFYISKELSPQEIIELQDAVIKTLISLRKIPPPMSMYDLPVFANCPYSKNILERGLATSQADFWNAFTDSSQPPLPDGFTRRKDDTLLYRDPKPYRVPDILQENSPRKQADDVVNYQKRKVEQDARRMERRHVEKRYRSWASLKSSREFDMAEADDRLASKSSKTDNDGTAAVNSSTFQRQPRPVTFQQIVHKINGSTTGQLTCRIRASDSEQNGDSLQWIDVKTPMKNGQRDQTKKSQDYENNELEDDVFESSQTFKESPSMPSSSSSMRQSTSPQMKSFFSLDNGIMKNSASPQLFFPDGPFLNNNSHSSSLYPFLPPYAMPPTMESSMLYNGSDEPYPCVGASETVRGDSLGVPFTYVHPVSGIRLTDPSAYLNSFVPSPITKLAPMSFSDETSRPRRSSEPTTPSLYNLDDFNLADEKNVCMEESKKMMDSFMKFDPPE